MFLTMVPLLLAATASPDPAWRSLWEQCRNETSPEVRLACYDALSREAGRAGVISPSDNAASATGSAFQLGREADSGDLTLTRALADGNVLAIGCASSITQLRLTLSRPWAGETVTSLLDGMTISDGWFVRNRGLLLESGRGLPAIETLKRWIGHRELVLSGADGDVLRIDLTGLGEALTPLRQQCRW
ncbi:MULTISPECIES: type VI secretion system-associated protein VasI [unclassified Brenneria]|uniref:type VI secretion system-associated protein VasI n=1 Tax=unclassified Brenneria TaxID=2634434 RepID=UPI00155725F0|nr:MULTISPECIES: type VI secretion system-associated protein VasI [unclassified Brenneria]MBJ7223757.1 type VI secretion system-associated protein TagO [Brenneria sp. L3-3C-1]MEE3645001.1 type VI secretion system-associated protein VasI [Brenneria sp. L3_3C_1]MEE3652920.1 type VI secretion system-associated protein VasI [Brenneria sp. HEZEL_4_2_4]NPD02874.1 type VI secretion system-associated protein TagO [Brenneria sp. hezel4-2-4]